MSDENNAHITNENNTPKSIGVTFHDIPKEVQNSRVPINLSDNQSQNITPEVSPDTSNQENVVIPENISLKTKEEKPSTQSTPVEKITLAQAKKEAAAPITVSFEDDDEDESLISAADLLNLSIERGASDIHLAENNPIYFRISGRLTTVEGVDKLSRKQAEHIIYGMMSEVQKAEFIEKKDFDFAYEHISGNTFRANAFFKRKNLAMVTRMIPSDIMSMEELKLPPACMQFVKAKQGLILVTGPTGSGKSTSLASMLEWINQNMSHHIITIEDPIEFLFESKRSMFSQRELKNDTLSMANAMRSVLRQDPDIVVIGEMRDPETISAALTICETGHLVFGTLHTSGAPQTISRLVGAFSPIQQDQVRVRISESLVGVLSQRLAPKIGGGRCGIHEVFINTPALSNMIRAGDTNQLKNAIQTGGRFGMISMIKSAQNLIEQGFVAKEDLDWLVEDE